MVSDRLGHSHPRKFGDGADGGSTEAVSKQQGDEDQFAVDTWVQLRRGAGELRIQILMHNPRILLDWCSRRLAVPENRGKLKTQSLTAHSILSSFHSTSFPSVQSRHEQQLHGSASPPILECDTVVLDGKIAETANVLETLNSSAGANQGGQSSSQGGITNKGNSRGGRHLFDVYGQRDYSIHRSASWPELEQSRHVIVSTPPGQIPLDEVMSSVENQFCYSFSVCYSQKLPSLKVVDMKGGLYEISSGPQTSELMNLSLQQDLLYSLIREGIQRERWRMQLQVCSQLREALVCPPPFRSFLGYHRGSGGRAGVRVAGRATPPAIPWADLIASGIPVSLNAPELEKKCQPNAGVQVEGRIAFDRSTLLGMQLRNMRATVSSVSVTKEIKFRGGFEIDCAVYHIRVEFPATRESWIVLRRYRDFRELYASLPSNLSPLMAPLPPKSWRSLSSLTMTPEFLEDRRVGLDKVLRRLLIVASEEEDVSIVPELLSNFLGIRVRRRGDNVAEEFCECDLGLGSEGGSGGSSNITVQPFFEVFLPQSQPISLSISTHFRLIMWLVLSGAARRASCWKGLPYSSLASCVCKDVWASLNGSPEEWDSAALHFDAIDVDVNRTYVKCDEERETLRRVLRGFALHAPSVGYCQAMNFVALFLLRTSGPPSGCIDKDDWNEPIAFLLLESIALDVVPEYWEGINSMTRVQADLQLLRRLADTRIPALLSHLDATGLPLELLACDWLLNLFCRLLPPLTVMRVWSLLLLEGSEVLVFTALAILQLVETSILESLAPSASATADAINAMAAAMHDADELVELAVREKGLFFSQKGLRFRVQLAKDGVYDQRELQQQSNSSAVESTDGC